MTEVPTVVLLGTLDTKATETLFVRDRVLEAGRGVILVNVGVLGPAAPHADIDRETVGEAAGTTLAALVRQGDRGAAVTAMGRGAAAVVRQLAACRTSPPSGSSKGASAPTWRSPAWATIGKSR